MTDDEMVGWHHQLNGHDFEQAPGVGEGQGSLVCCSLWGHKESDMTEQLNSTEVIQTLCNARREDESYLGFCKILSLRKTAGLE